MGHKGRCAGSPVCPLGQTQLWGPGDMFWVLLQGRLCASRVRRNSFPQSWMRSQSVLGDNR